MSFNKINFRNFKTSKDFEGMVRVRKQCIIADNVDTTSYLEHFLTAQELAETINLNHCNPTKDILIVELSEKIIGYCQICWWTENDGTCLYLHVGYLIPSYRKKGIGTQMIHWCEKRIREIANTHPAQEKAMFGANASSTETDKIQILTEFGYKPVFAQVELEFSNFSLIKDTSIKKGFEMQQVRPDQLRMIWETINEVYADRKTVTAPTEEDYQEFILNPNNNLSLWQVAWHGDEIASLVLAEIKNDRAEVTEVATKVNFRKQGLAQTLLTKSLRNLQRHGITKVRLHTDGGNISGARSLYKKIGFKHLKDYIRYRKPLE